MLDQIYSQIDWWGVWINKRAYNNSINFFGLAQISHLYKKQEILNSQRLTETHRSSQKLMEIDEFNDSILHPHH